MAKSYDSYGHGKAMEFNENSLKKAFRVPNSTLNHGGATDFHRATNDVAQMSGKIDALAKKNTGSSIKGKTFPGAPLKKGSF